MLHREVHGALEALVPRIHNLPRQPIERLLHVQIVIRIVKIIIPEPVMSEALGDGFHVLSGEPVLLRIQKRPKEGRHLRVRSISPSCSLREDDDEFLEGSSEQSFDMRGSFVGLGTAAHGLFLARIWLRPDC